jgi:hypothetical protein
MLVLLASPLSLVRRQVLLRLMLLLLLLLLLSLPASRRFDMILRCTALMRSVPGAAALSAAVSASLPSSVSSALPLLWCQLLSDSLLL